MNTLERAFIHDPGAGVSACESGHDQVAVSVSRVAIRFFRAQVFDVSKIGAEIAVVVT